MRLLVVSLVWVAACAVAPNSLAATVSAAVKQGAMLPAPISRAIAAPYFEKNVGQFDQTIEFAAHGGAYDMFLAPGEALIAMHPRFGHLRMRLADADAYERLVGLEPGKGRINYLIGNDPASWRAGVPVYGRVEQHNAWPGIDVADHVSGDEVEWDFLINAAANPESARFTLEGADRVTIDARGDLDIQVRGRQFRLRKPEAFQGAVLERKFVAASYRPNRADRRQGTTIEVGFRLAAYDHRQPVTIDPILSYSSFIGGANNDAEVFGNAASSIVVDGAGNAYIAGSTAATDFPVTAGAYLTEKSGPAYSFNAFVAKFNLNAAGAAQPAC